MAYLYLYPLTCVVSSRRLSLPRTRHVSESKRWRRIARRDVVRCKWYAPLGLRSTTVDDDRPMDGLSPPLSRERRNVPTRNSGTLPWGILGMSTLSVGPAEGLVDASAVSSSCQGMVRTWRHEHADVARPFQRPGQSRICVCVRKRPISDKVRVNLCYVCSGWFHLNMCLARNAPRMIMTLSRF